MSPATPSISDRDRFSNTPEFADSDLVLAVNPDLLDEDSLLGEEERAQLGDRYVEAMQAALGERWTVSLAYSGEFDGVYVDGNTTMSTDLDVEVAAAGELFWGVLRLHDGAAAESRNGAH